MISGVKGKWAEPEEVTRPEIWGRQLRQPVQFSAAAEEMLKSLGAGGVLLEVGPGRTLCSLVEKHLTPEGGCAWSCKQVYLKRTSRRGKSFRCCRPWGSSGLWAAKETGKHFIRTKDAGEYRCRPTPSSGNATGLTRRHWTIFNSRRRRVSVRKTTSPTGSMFPFGNNLPTRSVRGRHHPPQMQTRHKITSCLQMSAAWVTDWHAG